MGGKLNKFFKYRKIKKYLETKDKNQYNYLDNIFKFYVDGHMEILLNNYHFLKIEYYPQISKIGNYLQIDFWCFNLHVNIEFDDDCFDYIVYLPGISAEEFDKSVIKMDYSDDFTLENFFENFYNMLQKDNRLKK